MPLSSEIKKGIKCDSVGKPDSTLGRAVCLAVHPGKMILFPFLHWFEKRYKGKYKFARLLFSIDLFLIGVILTLASVALYVNLFLPKSFADRIFFDASIAPAEITTGAPATFVIRYTNGTSETLRQVQMAITFPKYFVLQEFQPEQGELSQDNHIFIDSIPPGGSGNIHIKGVLFGDVGGEQAFQTKMTFVHGEEKDVFDEKLDWQVFHPTRSALKLTLDLPERIIAFQPIEGVVHYDNTSDIDFPVVSLLPQWPEGFVFTKSNATMRDGQFEIPSVKAGETGEFRFEGLLKEPTEQVMFVFHPSFTFQNDRYQQESLVHTAPVVQLPIQVTANINDKNLTPGSKVSVMITSKNTSDSPIRDILLGIETDHPLVKNFSTVAFDIVEPGEEITKELILQLNSSISSTQINIYEQLVLSMRATATYDLDSVVGQQVTSKSVLIERPITSPVRLETFVRYFAPSGDQIGRGPIPPEAGKETTYWIFWHVNGTTNELTNVRIESELADGVRFTGRQTVSQNGSVTYDEKNQTVVWTSSSISPTLAPSSKIVGIAFEVGVTPDTDLKTAPELIKNIRLTGVDGWTGSFVSAQGLNLKGLMEK